MHVHAYAYGYVRADLLSVQLSMIMNRSDGACGKERSFVLCVVLTVVNHNLLRQL